MLSSGSGGISPDEWRKAYEIESKHEGMGRYEARDCARRLVDDCINARYVTPDGDPDVKGYLREYAENNPAVPSGKPFAFWSFKSAPDRSSRPVSHQFLARACASSRGYEVLEETDAGKKLDAYRLYENNVLRTLERDYDVKRTDVMGARDDAWSALSDSYAKAARGEVQVFAADVAAKSVLGKDELPALRANPHVGVEQIRFAVDMPRHDYLPEDVDEFLSNDAVRAQVPMEYYLKDGPDPDMRNDLRISPTASPPHVLADRCEKIAVPAHLETQRQGIVGRLRSASSFADVEDRDRSHSTGTVAEAGTVQTTGKVFGGGTGIASTSSVSSGAAENAGAESTMPAAMSAGKRKSPHGKTSSSTSPAGEMSHLDRSRSASRSSTTRQVHSGGHR